MRFGSSAVLKVQPNRVVPWICEVGKSLVHSEHEECGSVGAERYARVAFLDFVQGHPADERAFSHHRCRNAAPTTCITNLRAEFRKRATNRNRQHVFGFSRHMSILIYSI